MRTSIDDLDLDAGSNAEESGGGFFGLALLALAAGAGAALLFAPAEGAETRRVVGGRLQELRGGAEAALERVQYELHRRQARRRREQQTSALIGLAVGAAVAALLVPESGPATRHRIAERLRRHKEEVEAAADRVVREPQPG
jgi:gas vesicle protein